MLRELLALAPLVRDHLLWPTRETEDVLRYQVCIITNGGGVACVARVARVKKTRRLLAWPRIEHMPQTRNSQVDQVMRMRVASRAAVARSKVAFHLNVIRDDSDDWASKLNIDDTLRVLGFQVCVCVCVVCRLCVCVCNRRLGVQVEHR